jgi:PAS domain S-box-containing protein
MQYTFAEDRDVDPSLFRILVEQAPDASIFFEPNGIIRVWNQRASELFGYTANEALGKSFGLVIREDFSERHWQGLHDAILHHHTTFGTSSIATRALRKDGGTLYVEFAFSIVNDELVRIVGFMASARDITQRHLVQRAALEAEMALHGNRSGSTAGVASSAGSMASFVPD